MLCPSCKRRIRKRSQVVKEVWRVVTPNSEIDLRKFARCAFCGYVLAQKDCFEEVKA